MLTYSDNSYTSTSGATGDAYSLRLMVTGSVAGERELEKGATLRPYANLIYASEQIDAFTLSDGSTSAQDDVSIGRIGLGVEYARPRETGTLLVRGELGKVFGGDDVILPNNLGTYSPNTDATGSLTLGWTSNPSETGSTRTVELTYTGTGDGEFEEVRLDAIWNRSF